MTKEIFEPFLSHAVPQKCINILKGNFTEPLEKCSEKDNICLDKLSCRSATIFFVKSKFVMPTAERRMKEASLKEHMMQLIYSLPFNVIEDTRLAIIQYKIIHQILLTNSTLFRDSIKRHNNCHLCGERQTLSHLFVNCSEAWLFWSLFTNWWSSKNRERITRNKNEIVYGSSSWLKPRHDYSQILSIYCLKKRRRVLFRCFLSDFDKQN